MRHKRWKLAAPHSFRTYDHIEQRCCKKKKERKRKKKLCKHNYKRIQKREERDDGLKFGGGEESS